MNCPHCNSEIEYTEKTLGKERLPKAGSWFVCCECASISRFVAWNALRVATVDEMADMKAGERSWLCGLRRFFLMVKTLDKPS